MFWIPFICVHSIQDIFLLLSVSLKNRWTERDASRYYTVPGECCNYNTLSKKMPTPIHMEISAVEFLCGITLKDFKTSFNVYPHFSEDAKGIGSECPEPTSRPFFSSEPPRLCQLLSLLSSFYLASLCFLCHRRIPGFRNSDNAVLVLTRDFFTWMLTTFFLTPLYLAFITVFGFHFISFLLGYFLSKMIIYSRYNEFYTNVIPTGICNIKMRYIDIDIDI